MNQSMEILDQVIPLSFGVLAEVLINNEEETKTEGGIILTHHYADKIKHRGEILKIVKLGEDAFLNCFGTKGFTPDIGSFCFVKQNAGYLIKINGKDYRIVPSECIIAIIPQEVVKEYYPHINNL